MKIHKRAYNRTFITHYEKSLVITGSITYTQEDPALIEAAKILDATLEDLQEALEKLNPLIYHSPQNRCPKCSGFEKCYFNKQEGIEATFCDVELQERLRKLKFPNLITKLVQTYKESIKNRNEPRTFRMKRYDKAKIKDKNAS